MPLLGVLILAGCTQASTSSGERLSSPHSPGTNRAVKLVSLDQTALAACRTHRQLRPACPRLAPMGVGTGADVFRQGQHWTFSIGGGTSYANPHRDRPPAFVHLVVQGDDLAELPTDVLGKYGQ